MSLSRPSLRDIASKARVSTATVSLALRNHPRISAAMRAQIHGIAKEIGYTPDPLIARLASSAWSALREKGTTAVAFVTGNTARMHVEESRGVLALEGFAPGMGYRVECHRVSDHRSPERLAAVLEARGIQGILLEQNRSAELIERFPWNRFVTVACSVSIHSPPVHLVCADYAEPVRESWERCMRAGYRRVGVALLKEVSAHDDVVRTGLAEHLERSVMARVNSVVRHFGVNEEAAFVRWMERHRFEAVIGLNDTFYWWLVRGGFRCPGDVAYLSLIRTFRPEARVAGWDTREDLVARSSLEQLDLMIRSGLRGFPERPYTLLIQPEWVDGQSFPSSKAMRSVR